MKLGKVACCLCAGALCVATGGLAAPAIGAVVGSSVLGLSGAAATSAGLAALGGGSLAVGGLGMAGGTALIQAVAGGVGLVSAGIVSNAAEGAKSKRQNKELREELRQANIDNATKQRVITQLNSQIETLKEALKEEKGRSRKNQEKIKLMEEQLNDLEKTLQTAYEA